MCVCVCVCVCVLKHQAYVFLLRLGGVHFKYAVTGLFILMFVTVQFYFLQGS